MSHLREILLPAAPQREYIVSSTQAEETLRLHSPAHSELSTPLYTLITGTSRIISTTYFLVCFPAAERYGPSATLCCSFHVAGTVQVSR